MRSVLRISPRVRVYPRTPLGPDPTPDIAARRHIEPAATYEPRQHIRPTPREEPAALWYDVACCRPLDCTCAASPSDPIVVEMASSTTSPHPTPPFPPVWAILPPVTHDPPIRRPIKVIRRVSDTRCKGLVIDLHI